MSLFTPMDPLFKTRVQDSFSRQEVMRTPGIEIALLEASEITLAMPYAAPTSAAWVCSRRHRRHGAR